jgi:hypothetical protein
MREFLLGVVVAMTVSAAAFFWRFWRQSRDRFFALFSLAFVVMAANRLAQLVISEEHEGNTWLYVVRLLSFVLILVAIWDKNRSRS